jgi:transposase
MKLATLRPIPKVVESDESFVIPCAAPESSTGGAEMWKPEHRRAAVRHGLRYPSDLTDAEWVLVEPMIPPAKRGGRRREVNVREVLNAIFYVLSTGCQWQALPKDLRPKSTARSYFMLWDWDGTKVSNRTQLRPPVSRPRTTPLTEPRPATRSRK